MVVFHFEWEIMVSPFFCRKTRGTTRDVSKLDTVCICMYVYLCAIFFGVSCLHE